VIFLPKRRLVLLWATVATSLSQAMTRTEYSLKLFLRICNLLNEHSHFNDAKLWLERSLTRAVSAQSIFFEWKWLLIGLRGFIDRFLQNKISSKIEIWRAN